MRMFVAAALVVVASGPVLAQAQRPSRAVRHGGAQVPVDHGPFTPEASRAYQGGGVVLEGVPGGPAPTPQATLPGQTPRGAVSR